MFIYLDSTRLLGIFFVTCGTSFAWEYGQPREEQPNYGAWYQLPNPAPPGAYPPPTSSTYDRERTAYDRSAPAYERTQPTIYDRERERSPTYPRRAQPDPYYPEAPIANNLLPAPRTPPAGMVVGAFYPGVQPNRRLTQDVATTQDNVYPSAIDRYLPLLAKRTTTTTTQRSFPDVQKLWKCTLKPCRRTLASKKSKSIPPSEATFSKSTPATRKPIPDWIRLTLSSTTEMPPETPIPTNSHTSSRWGNLELVKPYTFRPRYITEKRQTTTKKVEETTTTRTTTEKTTTKATPTTTERRFWPNAELIAAIKDVVKKFRASLDRSGVHDDIRQMGAQLENTWNEMRRGLEKSWSAVRQSAESAIIPQFTPEVVALPASKLQDALQAHIQKQGPSLAGEFTQALNRMHAAIQLQQRQPTAAESGHDSGKLDQWIERANRMLADAIDNQEVTKSPAPAHESHPNKKVSKKSNPVDKMSKKMKQEPKYSETVAYFSINQNKPSNS